MKFNLTNLIILSNLNVLNTDKPRPPSEPP